jgi:pimeloyl-ACP methyl ester carboxylesterase
MNTSQLSVGGGQYRIRLWTDGQGAPLLFLHGFEAHPGDAAFLQRLAQNRRVFAPEHPGFGESTGIDEIDGILDMVLYYRQLIETLGLQQVDVIGHSLGGMFGAELAAICPEYVRKLVLVAPFGLWLDEHQVPDMFVMNPGQIHRATWHNPEGPIAQQALSAATNGATGTTAIVTRAMNLSAAGKFLWPIPDRGLVKRLPLIKAPTLVLTGESDRLVAAAYGNAFAARIARARHSVIAGAGHFPMSEQEDAFIEAVEGFLGS